MSDSVIALIPVLGRPERIRPLIYDFFDSELDVPLSLYFLVSADDDPTYAELENVFDELDAPDYSVDFAVVPWVTGPGDYARKINHGIRLNRDTEWWFTGADDLHFHPGWADAALDTFVKTGSTVIGTNDLGNPATTAGDHATHNLVHRAYMADKDSLLFEGYDHNWVDTELVSRAKYRGVWSYSTESVVEHLHPVWEKGRWDATYRKGQAHYHEDALLFKSRASEWGGIGLDY